MVIDVVAKDNHPPELAVSATEGFIDENSALGTLVLDKGGNPIRFTVSDRDQVREMDNPISVAIGSIVMFVG